MKALRSLFLQPKPNLRKQDILAFPTITMLLSCFEHPPNSKVTRHISQRQQDELSMLNALSTLLARQYEAAAVTLIELKGTDIQVVASVELETSPELFQTIDKVNPPPEALKKGYSIHPLMSGQDVSLVDPDTAIPEALSANQEGDLLKIFLETQWNKESFATHTWMLKTLLRRLKDHQQSESEMKNFVLYVIAACHAKMHYRITNGPSPLYFSCLEKHEYVVFDFIEHPDIPSTRPNGSSRDQLFLDAIPLLAEVATTKIPHLQQTAQLAIENKLVDIYNKETYMEFHALLCELLKRFSGSLSDLAKLKTGDGVEIHNALTSVLIMGDFLWTMARSAAIEKQLKSINHLLDFRGVVPNLEGEGQEQDGEGHEDDTEFDLLKPYNTSQGESLQPWELYRDWLRLQTIYFDATQVLARYVTKFGLSADISIKILSPSVPDDKMLSSETLLLDQRYFPDPSKHLYQPSGNDLFEFLSKFTANRPNSKEVEHMRGDEKWAESNEQSKGMAQSGMAKGGEGGSAKDDKCCEHMQGVHTKWTGASFETVIELVRKLGESEVVCMDLVNSVDDQMKCLKHWLSLEDDGHFKNTSQRILELKADNLTSQRKLTLVTQIFDMISVLKRCSFLYHKLKSQSLHCGENFTGTRHCEACIASLIYLSALARSNKHQDPQVDGLLSEFLQCAQAIGVSKRCCPVCAFLLDLLKTRDRRFDVTGEHSRISACTLPEWLPEDVIKVTVDEFAKRLRKQLVELYECEVMRVRERSGTSDTRRISMESIESPRKWSYDGSVIAAFFRSQKLVTK